MATNQEIVDTFNALMDSIDTRFRNFLPTKEIDKAKIVDILDRAIPYVLQQIVDFNKDKDLIACKTDKCRYELNVILPLEATKLQLENKLIKCQLDKCCYELEYILPLNKSILEKELEKITYEISDILPTEKSKLLCEITACEHNIDFIDTQRSELIANSTSTRDLNTIKGNLYDRQKDGLDDQKQLKMLQIIEDIWTITVAQEPNEDLTMDLVKRDTNKGEISGAENAIKSIANLTTGIELGKDDSSVPKPSVTSVSTGGTSPFHFIGNATPNYTVKVTLTSGTNSGNSYIATADSATGDYDISTNDAIATNDTYELFQINTVGTESTKVIGTVQ